MAKVIKRGGITPAPVPQPTKKAPQKRSGKVIDREVYNAQQTAQQIILKGENEKQHREEQGVLAARQAYDDSFKSAAEDTEQSLALALASAFQQRRALIDTAMEDVQTLAMEIIYKIVGVGISLSEKKQSEVISEVQKAFLHQRSLKIGVSPELQLKLEQEAPEFHTFITETPELNLEKDSQLNDEQAWVRSETLQFRAQSHDLLQHLAQCYGQPAPSFEPVQIPPAVVDDGSEGHEERTMAISLEELQKQAKAAKLLKNNDS